MGLFVDTTGTNFEIVELGLTLAHPTTNYDLGGQFTAEELKGAVSMTNAIVAGTLAWKKTNGGAIETPADYDPDFVDIESENLGTGAAGDRSVTFKDLGGSGERPKLLFSRSSALTPNTFLLNGAIPSNITGRTVPDGLANAKIDLIEIAQPDASTFDIGVYEHEGDEVNLTLIKTFSIVAQKTEEIADGVTAVDSTKQIALKLITGSAKNLSAALTITGV